MGALGHDVGALMNGISALRKETPESFLDPSTVQMDSEKMLSVNQEAGPQFSSVQSLSRVRLCESTNHSTQASLSMTNSRSLLKLIFIELVMPSNLLIFYCPLLLLPSIFPSIRVFSNELVLRTRWPKYWSFSFSISPSNEYSGLISFRMDWLDLLAAQGTLKSLL